MAGRLWPVVLLVLCGALVYANALDGPFIFDDEPYIQLNEDIRRLWPPTWAMATEARHAAVNGRPLLGFTLALNYALGGLSVTGYHGFNIGVHLLCGVALLGVARRLLARVGLADRAAVLALGGALLWVAHPLNSEVVNYVAQRSASLMALCYLGTLYGFLRGADGGRGWWILSVVCCGLGMLAKEVMVSAPVAVLVVDGLVVSGGYGAALRRHRGLYGGLALTWGLLWWGLASVPHGQTIGFGGDVGTWTYLLNQAQMIAVYLRLVLWPDPLVLDYGVPQPLALGDAWWQGLVVLFLLAGTGWLLYRRRAWGLVGAVFFLGLAPTSSVVPILTEVGAERRMYLPLCALLPGLVVGANVLWRRWAGGRLGWALAGLVALALGWTTSARNAEYADPVALWQGVTNAMPDNPRGHYNFANALRDRGDAAAARRHFLRALDLQADYTKAHYNLAQLLLAGGQLPAAIEHYGRAADLDPGFIEARINLGIALVRADRLPEALPHFRRAAEAGGERPEAHYNYGLALQLAGRMAEAAVAYRRALALRPGYAEAQARLAAVEAE